jgi:hypothetical protein
MTNAVMAILATAKTTSTSVNVKPAARLDSVMLRRFQHRRPRCLLHPAAPDQRDRARDLRCDRNPGEKDYALDDVIEMIGIVNLPRLAGTFAQLAAEGTGT